MISCFEYFFISVKPMLSMHFSVVIVQLTATVTVAVAQNVYLYFTVLNLFIKTKEAARIPCGFFARL